MPNIQTTNQITCPNCDYTIDIDSLIQTGAKARMLELETNYKQQFEAERLRLDTDYKSKLDAQRQKIEQEKNLELESLQKAEKEQRVLLKQKWDAEHEDEQKLLNLELEEKTQKLKELNTMKIEIERIKREKDTLEESIRLKLEQDMSIKFLEERQQIKELAEQKYELKIFELQKQLEDQKHLTDEMKLRQEQGSMQLQGEVQELAIEAFLRETFRYDDISEIAKGANGADTLQVVNTPYSQNCGIIYYESKLTKTYKDEWIDKFKQDMQAKNADIGVIVTAVYPKDMDKMGLKNGVYVCSFSEFKALSGILRELIIRISNEKSVNEHRQEKSDLLYNYLTGNEFKLQIETILNTFVSMQSSLDAEKRAMNTQWKRREKEIACVINSITSMHGSLQGIAGNEIKSVPALELPLLATPAD